MVLIKPFDTSLTLRNFFHYPDRHDEFMKLEQSIREVYELFVELSALVESQGDSVNNIAQFVDEAVIHVEKGNTEIHKARVYKDKARRRKLAREWAKKQKQYDANRW